MLRRHRTTIVCAVLGLVLIVGAALQGAPEFTGLRWDPTAALPPAGIKPTMPNLPSASSSPGSPPPAHTPFTLDLTPVLWIIAAIIAFLVVIAFLRWWARRPPRQQPALLDAEVSATADLEPQDEGSTIPDAPTMRRGFAHALRILNDEREPHDAIVKAWLGLQEAAEESGIQRRAAETPTEFTSRIVAQKPADEAPVAALLGLYLRVRFGDHPATQADVMQARQAYETLATSWAPVHVNRDAGGPS
ncbi:DUF4129 domain-containing protein [Leifsonia sp. Root112D2]|jgi:hypothetical protein|uniref:DUF4129 domain-containing protein n=1 Tax=Leifsonia sp. Root112D2 TaxID=1736426 RepID=UPI0006F4BC08|nr:DUF4129 domain-containing protein [Leifsonia sp. Root112D2]KQV08089.1 hypothetical protein ASC63_13160 [Leifsonia sp. Root112D2]